MVGSVLGGSDEVQSDFGDGAGRRLVGPVGQLLAAVSHLLPPAAGQRQQQARVQHAVQQRDVHVVEQHLV